MEQVYAQQDLQTLLRSHGLRATPQRIAVAELLLEESTHVTPQEVFEELKGRFPSISPNTIYLTLAHFEEAGLLRRFHIDGRAIFDSNTHRHDHAYCRSCGKLVDVPASGPTPPPGQLSDWEVKSESRVWFGLCPDCAPA